MIRNLKILGLALAAVLAMSAIGSSVASAQGQGIFTADSLPLFLDITETGEPLDNSFTAFEEIVDCTENTYSASEITEQGTTTITVTPVYKNCKVLGSVTVFMNGCDYRFHIDGTVENNDNTWTATVDLVCPAGKVVEIIAYSSGTHALKLCTIKVAPGNNLTEDKLHFTNTFGKERSTDDLTLTGTVTLHAEKLGLCGAATTTTAIYHVDMTIKGTDKNGKHNGIEISTKP